jgi:glucan phosphoethanolaminetransferase (alkaline phosphatase superfamily)
MEKLKLDRTTLRKFGLTLAIAFLLISGLFLFRQRNNLAVYSLAISLLFVIMRLAPVILLKPVYIIWMRFAVVLGWINTRVILLVLFYLVFTPLGLLMRLFKIDLLERKGNPATYWKKKEKTECSHLDYERRF